MIKEFLKNLKQYLNYLMKVGFGDLFIQFIILVIILVLACFVCVPISLIQDIVVSFMDFGGQAISDGLYNSINLVFKIINFVVVMAAFMYLFNKRYDDVKKMEEDLKKQEKVKKKTDNDVKKQKPEDIDLPKEK